ncbi:ATP-dependent DNA ligase [Nocardia sp. IFM 10818]
MVIPTPMLAVNGDPPDGPDWAVEMKWDGARMIAVLVDDSVRLFSRNQRETTSSYPEIVTALTELSHGRTMTLDGEIVAQNAAGAPSFPRLQRRLHVANPTRDLQLSVPVQFFVFDLLALDGQATTGLPYSRRREKLDELKLDTPPILTPPALLAQRPRWRPARGQRTSRPRRCRLEET